METAVWEGGGFGRSETVFPVVIVGLTQDEGAVDEKGILLAYLAAGWYLILLISMPASERLTSNDFMLQFYQKRWEPGFSRLRQAQPSVSEKIWFEYFSALVAQRIERSTPNA